MKNSWLRINESCHEFYESHVGCYFPTGYWLLPIFHLILILLFWSCGTNSTEKISKEKTAGQTLYKNNCTSCHGEDGKLCVLGAKDLSITTMNKEQMMEIITNGKSTMTPFGSVMNKEEISQVAEYVATLKK